MQTSKNRTSESGGILSFVLVGLLLVGLLAGGLYLIYGRSSQIANIEPSTTQVATDDEKVDTKVDPDAKSETETVPQGTPSTPQPNSPVQQAPSTGPGSALSAPPIANSGPTETLISTIALGLITASAMTYVQSRRTRQS